MSTESKRFNRIIVSALAATSLIAASVLAVNPVPAQAADSAAQPATLAEANAGIDGNISSLNQQASSLQGQIGETDGQIAQLEAEQTALRAKLEQKKALLRQTVHDAYIAGDPSSVEILASNQSFSGVVGQQHYRDQVSEKTGNAAKEVKATEQQISEKVADAQKKRDGLTAMKGDLDQKIATAQAQEQAKQALAEATQNKEAEYQKLVKQGQQEQVAAVAAPKPAGGGGGGGGIVRGNNPYTPGQCTWYVFNQTGRGQMGNAGQWSGGGSLAVGNILIMPPGVNGSGGVGHVGVIVSFSSSSITIRDMNWAGPFVVTTHSVPRSSAYRYL